MKYVDTAIVFDEVPDEITLAINISGCKIHCPDCHSKYLWEGIGRELNYKETNRLISKNPGITCVCIMGGEEDEVNICLIHLKAQYPKLKTAWYTGQENVKKKTVKYLDYVKTGPYIKERGPLNSRTTNQKFYKVIRLYNELALKDETYKFWKHENSSM